MASSSSSSSSSSSARSSSARYHPYLHSSETIRELAAHNNFDERIEAYDSFTHHASTFVGYLRVYNSKQAQLEQLKREIADLEEKMVVTHGRMLGNDLSLALLLPNHPSVSEEADSDSSDEEVTVVRTSASSSSSRRGTTPIIDLTAIRASSPQHGLVERVDINDEEQLVDCTSRRVFRVGGYNFNGGVRSRFYARMVPCSLCFESCKECFKCSNMRCAARVCGLCLCRIEPSPIKCPFCRSKYELGSFTERPISPPPIAPPRARSPVY